MFKKVGDDFEPYEPQRGSEGDDLLVWEAPTYIQNDQVCLFVCIFVHGICLFVCLLILSHNETLRSTDLYSKWSGF